MDQLLDALVKSGGAYGLFAAFCIAGIIWLAWQNKDIYKQHLADMRGTIVASSEALRLITEAMRERTRATDALTQAVTQNTRGEELLERDMQSLQRDFDALCERMDSRHGELLRLLESRLNVGTK